MSYREGYGTPRPHPWNGFRHTPAVRRLHSHHPRASSSTRRKLGATLRSMDQPDHIIAADCRVARSLTDSKTERAVDVSSGAAVDGCSLVYRARGHGSRRAAGFLGVGRAREMAVPNAAPGRYNPATRREMTRCAFASARPDRLRPARSRHRGATGYSLPPRASRRDVAWTATRTGQRAVSARKRTETSVLPVLGD